MVCFPREPRIMTTLTLSVVIMTFLTNCCSGAPEYGNACKGYCDKFPHSYCLEWLGSCEWCVDDCPNPKTCHIPKCVAYFESLQQPTSEKPSDAANEHEESTTISTTSHQRAGAPGRLSTNNPVTTASKVTGSAAKRSRNLIAQELEVDETNGLHGDDVSNNVTDSRNLIGGLVALGTAVLVLVVGVYMYFYHRRGERQTVPPVSEEGSPIMQERGEDDGKGVEGASFCVSQDEDMTSSKDVAIQLDDFQETNV